MAKKGERSSVAADLIDFLNASPTAFHAVGNRPRLLLSPLSSVWLWRKFVENKSNRKTLRIDIGYELVV